ncbi:hypothetical protein M9Y10_013891 [Tritrichomonas musculus]|uniref:Uncharacterized protein n=1 Tax=Tritrichomonas musculus TaxID=1915356 RepID=A0ABR2KY20_9EUKA
MHFYYNISIDGKYVPKKDYEKDVYYEPEFTNLDYESYYFKNSDNSGIDLEIASKGYNKSDDIVTFSLGQSYVKINITELYIEENTKFDSKEVYSKEIIDSKYIPKTDLFKIIKMCDNQYIRTIGENNFYGILNIFNNIYDRNDCFNVYTVNGNTKIYFGAINNYATLYYNKSIFRLLVNNAEIMKYDGTGTTINGNLTLNVTTNML